MRSISPTGASKKHAGHHTPRGGRTIAIRPPKSNPYCAQNTCEPHNNQFPQHSVIIEETHASPAINFNRNLASAALALGARHAE